MYLFIFRSDREENISKLKYRDIEFDAGERIVPRATENTFVETYEIKIVTSAE